MLSTRSLKILSRYFSLTVFQETNMKISPEETQKTTSSLNCSFKSCYNKYKTEFTLSQNKLTMLLIILFESTDKWIKLVIPTYQRAAVPLSIITNLTVTK